VSERILFENPERFFLGGHGLDALSRPVAFVHACLHAVLAGDARRIIPLRDVAQHLVGALAVNEVEDAARGLRAVGPTAAAVVAAVRLLALDLPGHPLVEWARRQKISRSDQMWLEIAARDGRLPRPALAMAALVSQPDLRHAAQYARIQASRRMPPRSFASDEASVWVTGD
jgi:hypothetical protein